MQYDLFETNKSQHNYETRARNDIRMENVKSTSYGLKGARNEIAHRYNCLPQNIKEITSQNVFKKEIKEYFYSQLLS